jgi:hypothetical protein
MARKPTRNDDDDGTHHAASAVGPLEPWVAHEKITYFG